MIRTRFPSGGAIALWASQIVVTLGLFRFVRHSRLPDAGYGEIAGQLLETGRFPNALRPPVYPLVLAALERSAGDGDWPVVVLHAHLAFLAALLVFLLVREAGGGRAGREGQGAQASPVPSESASA